MAAALLAGLALLAGAELTARRLARLPPPQSAERGSDLDYFYLEPSEPYFVPARASDGTPIFRPQRARATDQSFAAVKTPGTLRVFVVGGSVAMPFSDHLRARLDEFLSRALGRPVELVGCGLGGYDSWRDGLIEAEALRHEPDLLVVLSGNNEYSPLEHPPAALVRAGAFLQRCALFRWAQALSRRRPPTLDERLAAFETNLRLMVRRARAAGVPIALCTLPVDIRDVAPADAAPEALARYRQAQALDRRGDFRAARAEYLRAVDLDDPGDRCSPRRNALIRRVAKEEGAALADLDALFTGLVPDGLTDARLFKDQVHWYDEYYPLVSLAIVRALRDAGDLAPAAGWRLDWAARLEPSLRRPAVPRAELARAAEEVFLSGVSAAFRGPGLRERAVSDFMLAERRSPGLLARRLSSPDALERETAANPWLRYLGRRVRREWPQLLLHGSEALSRLGRAREAAALLARRAEAA